MLEYFPRKYLPRGELSSFAELVEGQDVTIIARVVHVSTRTMAARRGKITEVTITDRLADSSAHEESGFGGIGTVSVTPGRANASAPGTSSRGHPGWVCAGRQPASTTRASTPSPRPHPTRATPTPTGRTTLPRTIPSRAASLACPHPRRSSARR